MSYTLKQSTPNLSHTTTTSDSDDDFSSGDLNFVKDNTIYIHGNFNDEISSLLPDIRKLIDAQAKLKDGKIVFDIASYGGYVTSLHQLLSLIKQAKDKNIIVETRCLSHAYSCGAMLLIAGTKGHRYVSEFAQVLFHHAKMFSFTETDKQIERHYDHAMRLSEQMKSFIRDNTKLPKKLLNEMWEDDGYFMFSDELISYNVVDKLL